MPYLLKSGLLPTYACKASVALIDRTLELAPKWAHALLRLPHTMKNEPSFFARHLMKSCRTSGAYEPDGRSREYLPGVDSARFAAHERFLLD